MHRHQEPEPGKELSQGERESSSELTGKITVPKIFTRCFFVLLYRKSASTHCLAAVAEQPTGFVLAPQTHGSGYTLLPNQRCPRAPGWTHATGLGHGLETLAEQSRAEQRGLPATAAHHTWELAASDSAGHSQEHARNISGLKPEDFRFPCLGGRNTPSNFITLFISEGAAALGPMRVTGGATTTTV